MWKLSLGQALPLVKVSKYIHPINRLQSEILTQNFSLSWRKHIDFFFVIHDAPGLENIHTYSKDTFYRLMPLFSCSTLCLRSLIAYFVCVFLFVCFGSCNLLTLRVSAAFCFGCIICFAACLE